MYVLCRCGGGSDSRAWVLATDGDTWVHVGCGQPSIPTVERQNMLNIFQGGPSHNVIMETEQLVKHAATEKVNVTDYRWTPDTITGSATGRVARVWRHDPR